MTYNFIPEDTYSIDQTIISTTSSNELWYQWNDSYTTTSIASTEIYTSWIYDTTASTICYEESIEQQLNRIQVLAQERQAQQRQREQERLQAHQKSTIILSESLNHQQRRDFDKLGYFFVQSPSGRLYRIREGRAINIDLMKGQSRNVVEKRLCAHPHIDCPNRDTMLVQKVMLENMEHEFLRIANQYDPVRH